MKWLNRFLIFLIVVLVAVSIGLSIYYFMRNNETFSFGAEDGQSITKYVNENETFDIEVIRNNPSNEKYELKSLDEKVVKFVDNVKDNVFRFEAIGGGNTTIQLITSNEDYKNLNISVYVGDGSKDNPLFIRNYKDLSSIGTTVTEGYNLDDCYRQVADIDMQLAKKPWTPISNNNENGFTGYYDGNGYKISNMHIIAEGSDNAIEGETFVSGPVKNAGLFAILGKGAFIKNLNIENAIIDCDFDNAGVIAGINYGSINFVKIKDSIVASSVTAKESVNIGGVVGQVMASTNAKKSYEARVAYCSVNGIQLSSLNEGAAQIGGIAGKLAGGKVSNSYAISNITSKNYTKATIGGLLGSMANPTTNEITRCAVTNNYASTTFNLVSESASLSQGLLFGENLNNGVNKAPELKPIESDSWNNRILGNFCQSLEQNVSVIGGVENVTDAYLAMSMTSASLKNKPTMEQLEKLNTNGVIDDKIAFVSYNESGQFVSWDFDKVWEIESSVNNGLPYIRKDAVNISDIIYDDFDKIEVSSYEQLLNALAADKVDNVLDGKYTISQDLNLTGATEWQPIGTADMPFDGQFIVENDAIIYGLTLSGKNVANGFFGYVGPNAEIKGLTIKGVKITNGDNFVGAIAGVSQGTITDCKVQADANYGSKGIELTNDSQNPLFVGGIVGKLEPDASVQNCSVSINLNVNATKNNNLYVGGIAGSAKNADIIDCKFNGLRSSGNYMYKITVKSTAEKQPIFVGGIAGNLESSVSMQGCDFSGKIDAEDKENVIVGGLAGNVEIGFNLDKNITKCTATDVQLNGNIVGGLAGIVKSASKDFVAINVCAVNGGSNEKNIIGINGEKVGGLAGQVKNGIINNCSTSCCLSGKVMGGFAATIERANDSAYGKVAYSFSNCEFTKSAGKAYAETESEVRAKQFIWGEKLAGYCEHNIYNGDKADGAERRHSIWFGPFTDTPDDGKTSDEKCKQSSTFKSRGFDPSIWNLPTENNKTYPTLNMN